MHHAYTYAAGPRFKITSVAPWLDGQVRKRDGFLLPCCCLVCPFLLQHRHAPRIADLHLTLASIYRAKG